jgi:hypothetical protein
MRRKEVTESRPAWRRRTRQSSAQDLEIYAILKAMNIRAQHAPETTLAIHIALAAIPPIRESDKQRHKPTNSATNHYTGEMPIGRPVEKFDKVSQWTLTWH